MLRILSFNIELADARILLPGGNCLLAVLLDLVLSLPYCTAGSSAPKYNFKPVSFASVLVVHQSRYGRKMKLA
jgi:hypothetical protein